MAKVIMTSNEFVQRLKVMANEPNFYSSKYPFNVGMVCPPNSTKTFKSFDGINRTNINKKSTIAVSADCWNLIKIILNGYDVNNHTIGYYQKNLSNTGDVDGVGLLKQCTDVSSDFTKLKIGEPRYLYLKGSKVDHAGAYIGEIVAIDNHQYNVIESTSSWGGKILYSWVDADGTRRQYKGGKTNGKWLKHGLMTPWISYVGVNPTPTPTPTPAPTPKTTKVKVTCELPMLQKGSKGKAVKVWQTIVGTTADGDYGNNTKNATIALQKSAKIGQDGIVGKDTWTVGLNSLQ